jgi:hypothetical protein
MTVHGGTLIKKGEKGVVSPVNQGEIGVKVQ